VNQVNKLYKTAALIALLTAITFVIAAVLSPTSLTPMLIAAAVWLLMTIGLRGGHRWMGYIAFVVALASSLITFATLATDQWVSVAMLALCVVTTLILFVLIWRHPTAKHTAASANTTSH
jgi:hypothetical protein